jgi:hypothetical protein
VVLLIPPPFPGSERRHFAGLVRRALEFQGRTQLPLRPVFSNGRSISNRPVRGSRRMELWSDDLPETIAGPVASP